MSRQRVTLAQQDKIITILGKMQGSDYDPGVVRKEFEAWCKTNRREPDPSDETVRKWCKLAFPNRFKLPAPKTAGLLYEFAIHKELQLDPNDLQSMLLRSAGKLFASDDHYVPVGPLKRLHGTYAIIRRRWRLPDNDEQFIRCIVSFEATSDRVLYTEIERLGTTNSPGKDVVDESYNGYTFLFGSSIWVIAREAHRASLKFLTIHFCEPPIMNGNSPIYTCRGNLTAVCGFGPNESHRFVLKRMHEDFKCAYITDKEGANFLDKEDFDYLCYVNARKNKY